MAGMAPSYGRRIDIGGTLRVAIPESEIEVVAVRAGGLEMNRAAAPDRLRELVASISRPPKRRGGTTAGGDLGMARNENRPPLSDTFVSLRSRNHPEAASPELGVSAE